MSNKCVVVLAPNGRRQNVKVTPNTTILQVLEEVCRKQGFKAEEYDILHHNKVLDATSIMRYTGLPNNAQLEMAAALKTRAESSVKVGLALESGGRVMGEFEPTDSLWHVVETLCPDEAGTDESDGILPVIFYVGREECGIENLKKTTLRTLGLTSGGAILRYFKKARDDLNRQANVSAPLPKPVLVQEPVAKEPKKSVSQKIANSSSSMSGSSATSVSTYQETPEMVANRSQEANNDYFNPTKEEISSSIGGNQNTNSSSDLEDRSNSEDLTMDYEDTSQCTTQLSSVDSTSAAHPAQGSAEEPEETIIFLGERNAILFDVTTARACKAEDVPDDFFDLTVDDAKHLLRDMKRRQAALEEQPLVTSQYRELEKSKQMLSALNQYKRCIIKVQFPNQLVLQGTFTPLEKVSHVIDFVKQYLEDPSVDFEIFTTPPKQVLTSTQTLLDANCVPGALVYFLSSSTCPPNGSYIKGDVMAQVSTASAAAAAANSMRKNIIPRKPDNRQEMSAIASGSRQKTATSLTEVKSTSTSSTDKVPKWFKPK